MLRPRRRLRAALATLRDLLWLFRSGVLGRSDDALTQLAEELAVNERELRSLLANDGRDTPDIPGFDVLADLHRLLVDRLCTMSARTIGGLTAKARCVNLRDPSLGYDDAVRLGVSLAADVIDVFGDAA